MNSYGIRGNLLSCGFLVAIIYNNNLETYLKFHEADSSYVQWVQISKSLMGTDHDTQLGCLYIPPENMEYSRIESFDEIENELFVLLQKGNYNCALIRDFNSKTSPSMIH
jgi:hypothetical protein